MSLELQLGFYQMLMESQHWSPSQLESHQRGQLEKLLLHARANVPFYENRLDPVFRADGTIAWERWRELPIVTRRDMIEHRQPMQARYLPKGHGPTGVIETSGSTGLPISMTVSRMATTAAGAFRWRTHRWQDLDWSKVLLSRLGDGNHKSRWPQGHQHGPWGPQSDPRSAVGRAWTISREFDTPDLVRFLRESGASYLNAGPNMAHINALDARRLGLEIRIDAVLAQGNVVRQVDRDMCRDVFGARIVEFYSAKEGGQMASPCPHDRMHVNAEGCLLEILDENGDPCGPGETGRVIVTPFYQTGQPLIRYDQGDWATVGDTCPCGRSHPTIAAIKGRNIAIFRHPDGRAVANLMPDETTALLASSYWQLAQVAANAYELRYVPAGDNGRPDEAAVRKLFHDTFFADASLTFVKRESIPQGSGGKIVEYLSEV